MKDLFKMLRFTTTTAILIILAKSFGYVDWHTWVIWGLMWLAMFFLTIWQKTPTNSLLTNLPIYVTITIRN